MAAQEFPLTFFLNSEDLKTERATAANSLEISCSGLMKLNLLNKPVFAQSIIKLPLKLADKIASNADFPIFALNEAFCKNPS